MREITCLHTSLSFSISNSEPETLIFFGLNGKSLMDLSGLARRHSSKLELSRVMIYSMTAGTGMPIS